MSKARRLRYDPFVDYYVVLGVSPYAAPAEIQSAFRQRAKLLHPDRNKSEQAKEQFQLLNEAYDTLSDPTRRAEYNLLRQRAGAGMAYAPPGDSKPDTTRAYLVQHWRRVLGGLFSGPYRYVFMMLGIVAVANIVFIIATRANNLVPLPPDMPGDAPPLMPLPNDPSRGCDPNALILTPADGTTVSGAFDLIGTANGPYQIDWARFEFDSTGRPRLFDWQPLVSGAFGVRRGVLAARDQTAGLPGGGMLRLRLTVRSAPANGSGDATTSALTCEETISHP